MGLTYQPHFNTRRTKRLAVQIFGLFEAFFALRDIRSDLYVVTSRLYIYRLRYNKLYLSLLVTTW